MTEDAELLEMAKNCRNKQEASDNASELLAIGERDAAHKWHDLAMNWDRLKLPSSYIVTFDS